MSRAALLTTAQAAESLNVCEKIVRSLKSLWGFALASELGSGGVRFCPDDIER